MEKKMKVNKIKSGIGQDSSRSEWNLATKKGWKYIQNMYNRRILMK